MDPYSAPAIGHGCWGGQTQGGELLRHLSRGVKMQSETLEIGAGLGSLGL